mmetsp:Transcript_25396/g.37103  ORF Transcript_25396/g.37103 Transcript_25396/m.37103 type:complete len:253 (+) Transcript_25396:2344-3102(+)
MYQQTQRMRTFQTRWKLRHTSPKPFSCLSWRSRVTVVCHRKNRTSWTWTAPDSGSFLVVALQPLPWPRVGYHSLRRSSHGKDLPSLNPFRRHLFPKRELHSQIQLPPEVPVLLIEAGRPLCPLLEVDPKLVVPQPVAQSRFVRNDLMWMSTMDQLPLPSCFPCRPFLEGLEPTQTRLLLVMRPRLQRLTRLFHDCRSRETIHPFHAKEAVLRLKQLPLGHQHYHQYCLSQSTTHPFGCSRAVAQKQPRLLRA